MELRTIFRILKKITRHNNHNYNSLTLEHKPYLNLHHLKPWVKITRYLDN